MNHRHFAAPLAALAMLLTAAAPAQPFPDTVQTGSDIPRHFVQPTADYDYVRKEVMIPMRDGVKLHTVIMIPKGAKNLPMVLERTPYEADGFMPNNSPKMRDAVWSGDRDWADGAHILVWQDIRGKYKSQGDYVMTRPPRGPLNPTKTDDTTDAWDTIDWLVKHVPESNGKVGMIGSSYDGWTVVMALLDPHPALVVASPESPMIDGWMGDDWFHLGAFRQFGLDYFPEQMTRAGSGEGIARTERDDYTGFLNAGSAGDYAKAAGLDQLPWWHRLTTHPAYDAFWQGQALDKLVAKHPSDVPTIWLQGLWDQEDIYGAVHSYDALKDAGHGANNYLAIGPWFHSQVNRWGRGLGPFKWAGDTAAQFRQKWQIPFFDHYLTGKPMPQPMPRAVIYDAVANKWDSFADWPSAKEQKRVPLYTSAGGGLTFGAPDAGEDSYVSDPAHPVPFTPRPVVNGDQGQWRGWLTHDQRFAASRPDVLTFQTPVLTKAVRIEGAPFADIFAKTTGTDGDFVVKLIDVYPGMTPHDPKMGGYQLPVSMDILRGRYRKSFSDPSPIPAGEVQEYRFRLPTANWTFLPGHRIMVQVQSTLFPLYDRNPQTYVPNVFFAKKGDYAKATISVESGAGKSSVLLPVVESSGAQP
ncbi:CocE/NonD family hydrolase [Novosphingobium sp. ZN18A2]|uniref:CocE/NonD family hydrolase n=1 Tax=Novosphingobium sp. ZN18A2 TaxID=3079861 RepID=UPI0030CB1130